MYIKLWGVRGSLPAPLTNTELNRKIKGLLANVRPEDLESPEAVDRFLRHQPAHLTQTYGGDTTCIELRSKKSGSLFVIDAGTGLRRLGDHLIKKEGFAQGGKEVNFFITHTHWDHIQGFPFFVPAYIPGNQLHFYSPFANLRERFERQQLFENFPQPLEGMASSKDFHQFPIDGSFTIDGVTISCLEMNHPGRSFAYRFAEEDNVFIFATDAEFTMTQLDNMDQYRDFFQDADILVLDSQYTLEEAFYKFDWGHTSFSMAVNLGVGWNIKKLILTHHEPAYTDEKLYNIYQEAYEHRAQLGNDSLDIYSALQGMEFHL